MDSLRRRASLKGQQAFQEFHPSSERTQDASNHILTIHLPGFKRELVTVQVDNAGRLMVKGRRQESDGRYSRLDETFDVPKDVAIEKINGKFDEGRLIVFLPKVVRDQAIPKESKEEAAPKEKPAGDEEIKDERSIQEEKPKDEGPVQEDQKPREEGSIPKQQPTDEASVPEEKPTSGEERRDEGPVPKKKVEEDYTQKHMPTSGGDEGEKSSMKEEKAEIREEKTRGTEEEKARPKSTGEEEKEESLVQRGKKAVHGETKNGKEDLASNQKKPESWEEVRMRDLGPIRKDKAKRGSVWKEFGEEGWLEYGGVVDRLWEKMNRNRKVIAVAVIALSVGFYVSHKLRSTGK